MKAMKKYLAMMLAIMMCICVVPVNVQAEETQSEAQITDIHSFGYGLSEEEQEIYLQLKEHYVAEDGFANEITTSTEQAKVYMSGSYTAATSAEFQTLLKNEISPKVFHAAQALVRDYPQLYWSNAMSVGASVHGDADGNLVLTYATFKFSAPYENYSDTATFETKVRAIGKAIYDSVGADGSAYDYYKAIHDWICNKVTYNDAAIKPGADKTAYSYVYSSGTVFTEEGTSSVVCEGYSEAFKVLCDFIRNEYHIPGLYASIITGDAGGPHMWNYALLPNNKWYAVDVTWDDQEDDTGVNTTRYDYFLCGLNSEVFNGNTFGEDHTEDTDFDYKDISKNAYNPNELTASDWSYEDGKLVISVSGALEGKTDSFPWYQYKDEITTIEVKDSVTSLPEGVFAGYTALEELTVPFIGLSQEATGEQSVLGAIFGIGTKTSGAILQYHTLTDDGMVSGSYYSIPSTLKKVTLTNEILVGTGAFSNCTMLESVSINAGVDELGIYAFFNCTGLKQVDFYGDAPSTIVGNAFYSCGNLKAYIPAGNTTWNNMKKDYMAESIEWLEREAVTVDTDTVAKLSGVQLNLKDKIGLEFTVAVDDAYVDADDYMQVKVGDNAPYTIPVSESFDDTVNIANGRGFSVELNSKQMTEDVTVQMFVDGVGGRTLTYSVKQYGDVILASNAYASAHEMVKAMLNYGGYAQVWFDKATTGLANEGLYDVSEDPVLTQSVDFLPYKAVFDKKVENSGVNVLGVTMELETQTKFKIYFSLDEGKALADYQYVCGNKNYTPLYSNTHSAYYIESDGIMPTKLHEMTNIIFRDNAGQEVFLVQYGALSYAEATVGTSSKQDLVNLVKALYWYNQAAIAYSNAK